MAKIHLMLFYHTQYNMNSIRNKSGKRERERERERERD